MNISNFIGNAPNPKRRGRALSVASDDDVLLRLDSTHQESRTVGEIEKRQKLRPKRDSGPLIGGCSFSNASVRISSLTAELPFLSTRHLLAGDSPVCEKCS
jgi:hypothetical protein